MLPVKVHSSHAAAREGKRIGVSVSARPGRGDRRKQMTSVSVSENLELGLLIGPARVLRNIIKKFSLRFEYIEALLRSSRHYRNIE